MTRISRVGGCGRQLRNGSEGVTVNVRTDEGSRMARFGGVQLCGNVWLCPVCSASIRHGRGDEVKRSALAHLAAGGALAFVTLTLPHDAGDDLRELLDTIRNGWRWLIGQKGWRQRSARFGFASVSAVEITHGAHGWHPHLHVLVFLDRPMTNDERADGVAWLSAGWARYAERRGWRAPNEHGVRWQDVQGADGGRQLAEYLTKVQDSDGVEADVANELVRGDLKTGRKTSRTPFDVALSAANGVSRDLALWWEYEEATRGRKCLTWSKGLRSRFALPDVDDEDLADDQADDGECVAVLDREDWRLLLRHRAEVTLLEAAERSGLDGVQTVLVALRKREARLRRFDRGRRAWLARERERAA